MKEYELLTRKLIEKKLTITTMESCTAGLIMSLITDTEGSSAITKGGFVTYSNEAKVKNGVLFDDNAKVRKEWIRHNPNGWAFAEKNILEILEELSVPYNKFQ